MKKLILASSAALLALSVAACGPKTEQAAADATNTASDLADQAGAVAGNAMEDVQAAVTPTPTAQEFINTAAKSDAFEIESAKLAATNAASAEVKAFAADMITAHTKSSADIKAAAGTLTPDAALTKDQQDDLAELKGLKGAAFDEEYIDQQVDAHEDALTLMQGYAKDGDNASLKTAAGAIAPTVSKHLEMIRALDAKKD
ncbi:DUF4142 domain-containing protein [Sphingomonas crocodyli]|uniref:DUF4142 domain-containing protein n=1 Tax=Sphingomonas crocodyli TaxID=1979270 RepID=A0A437M832_9SPHN|nr:DUF4142 domain-containing protein [Sphingomonas crocodyli]RVT93654.1 DUF4142 domain-containing protein [Sphingomonas crocodyli]